MLSYHRPSEAAEGVLLRVNQAVARPRKPGAVGRRALRRGLSKAATSIERSSDYRRSLAWLCRCAQSFQACLEPEQLSRWLVMEDALHEHVARLERAYFFAGAAWGKELVSTASQSVEPPASLPTPDRDPDVHARGHAQTEAVIALARLVIHLTQR